MNAPFWSHGWTGGRREQPGRLGLCERPRRALFTQLRPLAAEMKVKVRGGKAWLAVVGVGGTRCHIVCDEVSQPLFCRLLLFPLPLALRQVNNLQAVCFGARLRWPWQSRYPECSGVAG